MLLESRFDSDLALKQDLAPNTDRRGEPSDEPSDNT